MGRRIRFFEACAKGVMCLIGSGRIDYAAISATAGKSRSSRNACNAEGALANLAASRGFLLLRGLDIEASDMLTIGRPPARGRRRGAAASRLRSQPSRPVGATHAQAPPHPVGAQPGRPAIEHLVPLLAAAAIVGLSKGGLASAGALAVPILALVMNPIQAAALLLPVLLVTDWVAVWLYRRTYSGRNLAILVPAMALGIAVATLAAPYTPESALLFATSLVGLWYVGRSWFRPVAAAPAEARVIPGLFWGFLTGITSFITHAGAPPSQAYLLPQRLPRLEFAGTIAIAFAVGNLAKVPGYWALGTFEALDAPLTAALIAAGVGGTVAGRWIVVRLHDATYVRIIEGLLLALSLLLVWRGVALLLGR